MELSEEELNILRLLQEDEKFMFKKNIVPPSKSKDLVKSKERVPQKTQKTVEILNKLGSKISKSQKIPQSQRNPKGFKFYANEEEEEEEEDIPPSLKSQEIEQRFNEKGINSDFRTKILSQSTQPNKHQELDNTSTKSTKKRKRDQNSSSIKPNPTTQGINGTQKRKENNQNSLRSNSNIPQQSPILLTNNQIDGSSNNTNSITNGPTDEEKMLKIERKKEAQFVKSYAQVTNAKSMKRHTSNMVWQPFSTIPDTSELFSLTKDKYGRLLTDCLSNEPFEENTILRGTQVERDERSRWRRLKRDWLLNEIQEHSELRIEEWDDEITNNYPMSESNSEEEIDDLSNARKYPQDLSSLRVQLTKMRFSDILEKSPAYLWMTKDPFSLLNWHSVGTFRPIELGSSETLSETLAHLEIMLTAMSGYTDEHYHCRKIASEFNEGLRKWWNRKLLERCELLEAELKNLQNFENELEFDVDNNHSHSHLHSNSTEGKIGKTGLVNNKNLSLKQVIARQAKYVDKLEEMKEFLLRHAAPWTVSEIFHFRKQQMDPMKDRQKMAGYCKEACDKLSNMLFFVRTDEVYPNGSPVIKPEVPNIKLFLSCAAEFRAQTSWKPETSPYTNKTTARQVGYFRTSSIQFDPYLNTILTVESNGVNDNPGSEGGINTNKKRKTIHPQQPNNNSIVSSSTNTTTMLEARGHQDNSKHELKLKDNNNSNSISRAKISSTISSTTTTTTRTIRRAELGLGTPKTLASTRNKKQVPETLITYNRYPSDQFDCCGGAW